MRKPCTKDNPSDGKPYEWYHPDAVSVWGEQEQLANHDDYDVYRCPHCGIEFHTTTAN